MGWNQALTKLCRSCKNKSNQHQLAPFESIWDGHSRFWKQKGCEFSKPAGQSKLSSDLQALGIFFHFIPATVIYECRGIHVKCFLGDTCVSKLADLFIQIRMNASDPIYSFARDNKVVCANESKSLLLSKYILTGTFCSIAHIKARYKCRLRLF